MQLNGVSLSIKMYFLETHLERYGEHQHSKDQSPEGPVPEHLRGKSGRS